MAFVILNNKDIGKLSIKDLVKLNKKSEDCFHYSDKTIYLFTIKKTKHAKEIYKKMIKTSKDYKILSVLFLAKDYDEAKKFYEDILISWIK